MCVDSHSGTALLFWNLITGFLVIGETRIRDTTNMGNQRHVTLIEETCIPCAKMLY